MRPLGFYFLFFGLLSFSYACQPQEDQIVENQAITPFFDLEQYFQKEVNRLEQQQIQVSKKITLDGKLEQQTLDSLNFSNELSVFIKSAINRPAWSDKYQVDSTFRQNELISLHYEALSDRLKTRRLDIAFVNGQISEIKIENLLETLIATTNQKLRYQPATGYLITNMQRIAFSKSQELAVEVQFRAP